MIPLVATAARMPFVPSGAKPSAAVKLPGCRPPAIATTRIARSGTPTFHQVAALFVWASLRTPRKLIDEMIAMRMTATIRPLVVRVGSVGFVFSQPSPNVGRVCFQPPPRERVVRRVVDDGGPLDRRHRRRLQPGEPSERGARRTTEGV